jgi:2-iminobutanoate/2-iminopropanoate deaminase
VCAISGTEPWWRTAWDFDQEFSCLEGQLDPFDLGNRICVNYNMREIVASNNAPKAIGPYSQAIKANGFVFVSGQIAIDPATQQVVNGDVSAQTERVLRNLSEILKSAGTGLEKVVRCGVFLKSMDDFAAMNNVYGKYFKSEPPARSTVEVSRLPKDVLVEIDVIALA